MRYIRYRKKGGDMGPASVRLQTKSGRPLHPVGIGTWGLGNYPAFSPGASMEVAAIRHALGMGQNHIDTAEMYGHGKAELLVGQAIVGLQRDDIFVTSKLWKDHVAKGTVRMAVDAMLQRLGTTYLDALYIHAPWFDAPWREAVPQINELIDEGLVRYLGVSNFNSDRFQEVQALTRQPVALAQLHYSCLHQTEVSAALKSCCKANGTAIVAYLPLERGNVLKNATIESIAQQHGVARAQVALSWLLAQSALPIPRALQTHHIEQNSIAVKVQLTSDDMARIGALAQG